MNPTVGIVITTRNRLDELRRTAAVIARLSPPPCEVLVCADGCSDGTPGFVRAEYPHWRLFEHARPQGSIPSRNELMRAATAEVLVSLDDDSHPLETNFLENVGALFAGNPRLAVASFPQWSDEFPASLGRTDFGPARPVGSYANCAAAVRRSVFLELGGYADLFGHVYEEPDFALRCLAANYEVRFEPGAGVIRHYWTASERNHLRTHHLQARNEVWSVVLRCPLPWLLPVALFRVARQWGYAWSRGLRWVAWEPGWWGSCLAGLPRCLARRKPVAWPAYRRWMELVRCP